MNLLNEYEKREVEELGIYKEGLTSKALRKYIKRIRERSDEEELDLLNSLEESEDVEDFARSLYDLLTEFLKDIGMTAIPHYNMEHYTVGFYGNDEGESLEIILANDKLFVHLKKHINYPPEKKRTAAKQEREDREVINNLIENTRKIALYEIPNMEKVFLNSLEHTRFTFLNQYIPFRLIISLPYPFIRSKRDLNEPALNLFLEFSKIQG